MVEYGIPEDIASWMALVKEVRWNFPGLDTEADLKAHEETVLKFMRDRRALCIKEADRTAAVLLFSRKYNQICCLAVHPGCRRKGYAGALLKKALEALDRERDILVSTFREGDPKGTAPRALYQKFGFLPGALIEEFGYPSQQFYLPADRAD